MGWRERESVCVWTCALSSHHEQTPGGSGGGSGERSLVFVQETSIFFAQVAVQEQQPLNVIIDPIAVTILVKHTTRPFV